jgi:hypothetical protein
MLDGLWTRRLSPEERAAELARDERVIQRAVRRALVQTVVACAVSLVVGLGLVGLGLHTTDVGWGQIAFFGGLVAGYTGIVVSMARCYLLGEAQGWWN